MLWRSIILHLGKLLYFHFILLRVRIASWYLILSLVNSEYVFFIYIIWRIGAFLVIVLWFTPVEFIKSIKVKWALVIYVFYHFAVLASLFYLVIFIFCALVCKMEIFNRLLKFLLVIFIYLIYFKILFFMHLILFLRLKCILKGLINNFLILRILKLFRVNIKNQFFYFIFLILILLLFHSC